MSARVLIVEDDPVARTALETALGAEGYAVVGVENAADALHAAQAQKPDLMVLDLNLVSDSAFNGVLDGFSMLQWFRFALADASFPVIIHTVDNSPQVDRNAKEQHVYAVFRKGDPLKSLLDKVRQALAEAKAAGGVVQCAS